MKLILATRASRLALAQAHWVQQALMAAGQGITVDLEIMSTRGDEILDRPLAEIGGKGLFTAELEDALREGRVQLAVHSMKDFPTKTPEGLRIAAIPERESPWDMLICRNDATLESLPQGAKVGTSSLRRKAQLLALRPDFKILPLRGNVETRLRKLKEGEVNAIVLAEAGLRRLDIQPEHGNLLSIEQMIPAASQGALCIETATDCDLPAALLQALHHSDTADCIALERAALHQLGGSCQVPVGVYASINANTISARACIADVDGKHIIAGHIEGSRDKAASLGQTLGTDLLNRGGQDILQALSASNNETQS